MFEQKTVLVRTPLPLRPLRYLSDDELERRVYLEPTNTLARDELITRTLAAELGADRIEELQDEVKHVEREKVEAEDALKELQAEYDALTADSISKDQVTEAVEDALYDVRKRFLEVYEDLV